MEALASGADGGVHSVEPELLDRASRAEGSVERVAGSVLGRGDTDEGVEHVALEVADFGIAWEFVAVVLHPQLEVAFDLAHVPLEDGERGVVIVDGSHGAVAELREIEHGRVEVAGLGELPAPRHDFACDGLEVAELLDLECAGVGAADGVVTDLHAFAGSGSSFKLASEAALVLRESVEKVELLREYAASHGDSTVGSLFWAKIWVGGWNEL